MFLDLMSAIKSSLPFGEAWKRLRCMRAGHVIEGSKRIDKLRSENHPQNCDKYVYTVNVMECGHCSLIFLDKGFESRSYK